MTVLHHDDNLKGQSHPSLVIHADFRNVIVARFVKESLAINIAIAAVDD